jgi:hypothetical protein
MKTQRNVKTLIAVLAIGAAVFSMALAQTAPRGFIGDTGIGWDTSSKVSAKASTEQGTQGATNMLTCPALQDDGYRDGYDGWNGLRPHWMTGGGVPSHEPQRGGTVVGGGWCEFAFDQAYSLDQMWIWNLNEGRPYPGYSMKTVTIQYTTVGAGDGWGSQTPEDWTTIFQGDLHKALEDADGFSRVTDIVNLNQASAQYVVLTTAVEPNQNWDLNSHADTGLGPVRFYPQRAVGTHNLTGSVALANYVGNKDLALIPYSLTRADGSPVDGLTLKSGDSISYPNLIEGNYLITLQAGCWLTKVINVTLNADTDLGVITLAGGDVNGDGAVGLLDLGLLKQFWGQHNDL